MGDETQSMEMTTDYQARIHDNFARKSMGRRVSFNQNCQVRLFTPKGDHTSTTATDSPQSSPPTSPPEQPPVVVNDENDYPGAGERTRRRRKYFGN